MKNFNISIASQEGDDKLPVLPLVILEELERNFNIDVLLSTSTPKNTDELCGYIRGVRDVLLRCRVLAHINQDKE